MRHLTIVLFIAAGCASSMLAQANSTPDLSGTWIQKGNPSIKWIVAEKNGNLHLQIIDRTQTTADFTCNLNGQECQVKEDGHPEKITMYYNGTKLVAIKERGDQVVKQRISVASDGKSMEVDTVPLSNSDKVETLIFERQTTTT